MTMTKRQNGNAKKAGQKRVDITLHSSRCKVCKSQYCKEIEAAFVAWHPTPEIGATYGMSHDSVERHAFAFKLRDKRDGNIRGALTQLITRGMLTGAPVKPETIVSASKLKAQLDGDFVEKHEEKITLDLSKSMQRRTDKLIDAIGGVPDGVTPDGDSDTDK